MFLMQERSALMESNANSITQSEANNPSVPWPTCCGTRLKSLPHLTNHSPSLSDPVRVHLRKFWSTSYLLTRAGRSKKHTPVKTFSSSKASLSRLRRSFPQRENTAIPRQVRLLFLTDLRSVWILAWGPTKVIYRKRSTTKRTTESPALGGTVAFQLTDNRAVVARMNLRASAEAA